MACGPADFVPGKRVGEMELPILNMAFYHTVLYIAILLLVMNNFKINFIIEETVYFTRMEQELLIESKKSFIISIKTLNFTYLMMH